MYTPLFFRPVPAARFAVMALMLAALFSACEHEPLPLPHDRSDFADPDRRPCDEFVFDTALANGWVATKTLKSASLIHDYLPPAENLLGVRQRRYWARLDPDQPNEQHVDVVWLHGGGADVGMAANDKPEVFRFLSLGYRVWVVEYRRGWLASSYDPCMVRDANEATEADWLRMPQAADTALADVKAALLDIRSRSGNRLVLFGTSFGASLALACGPYADAGVPETLGITGVCAAYGSLPYGTPYRNAVPTVLWHGLKDQINGPDVGTLYHVQAQYGVPVKGSRRIYRDQAHYGPTWLFLHRGGHSYGPINAPLAAERMLRCVLEKGPEPGVFLVAEDAVTPFDEGG